ncbi:MAG TPA: type II toxin-antitoxin system RelE/ParE family toxin [Gammaproteobacteria bacterium]
MKKLPQWLNRQFEKLVKHSRLISELPNAGRRVPEYQQDDLREVLERPYRIIYRILNDRIDDITVMHNRQLLPGDLNELIKPLKQG